MRIESLFDRFLRRLRTKLVAPYITQSLDICDIGCGVNQYLLKSLADVALGKLVGIDSLVANSLSHKIELRSANLEQEALPIDDHEFDLVTMLAVLEHLNGYDNVIRECYRGLKKEGRLILTTPSPYSKPLLEFLADMRVISYFAIYDHKKYFKKEELISLLYRHNFRDVKVWSVACGLNTVAMATK